MFSLECRARYVYAEEGVFSLLKSKYRERGTSRLSQRRKGIIILYGVMQSSYDPICGRRAMSALCRKVRWDALSLFLQVLKERGAS